MANDVEIRLNGLRLADEPTLEGVGTNGERCKFRVLSDQGRDDRKTTVGWNVTVFGKSAAWCASNLSKGQEVTVLGRLEQRLVDSNDGNGKRLFIDVVADAYKGVIPGRKAGAGNGNGNGEASSAPAEPVAADMPF